MKIRRQRRGCTILNTRSSAPRVSTWPPCTLHLGVTQPISKKAQKGYSLEKACAEQRTTRLCLIHSSQEGQQQRLGTTSKDFNKIKLKLTCCILQLRPIKSTHAHKVRHTGSLREWEFVMVLSLDCTQACAHIQIKWCRSFWGFFSLFMSRNDKKHQSCSSAGLGSAQSCYPKRCGWVPSCWLQPGVSPWRASAKLCPSGTAKCLALEKLVGWVYRYIYNKKDNFLLSVELWASRNLYYIFSVTYDYRPRFQITQWSRCKKFRKVRVTLH